MVELNAYSVEIDGKAWNKDKSGYPHRPTVYSGVSISFGADSCIDHPESSTASISLWLPKRYVSWMPSIGTNVKVQAGFNTPAGDLERAPIFSGRIDSVQITDDHKPAPAPYESENIADAWQNITSTAGWKFEKSLEGGTKTDITASVVVDNANAFKFATSNSATNQGYWITSPKQDVLPSMDYKVSIGLTPFINTTTNTTTVRQYTSSGVLITSTTLRDPFTEGSIVTRSNTATIELTTYFNLYQYSEEFGTFGDIEILQLFANDLPVENEETAGYRINLECSDALAAAGRLRLADSPWGSENGLNRMQRIAELASMSGVAFNAGLTIEQGYTEMVGTRVRARDVDSANALEAFQDTAMSGGQTIGSINNVVQPNYKLLLPKVLSQSGDVTVAAWLGTPHASKSVMRRNGVEIRRNEASNPQGEDSISRYSVIGGGGTTQIGRTYDRQRSGSTSIRANWNSAATSVGGVAYTDTTVTGAAGETLSGGVWVRWNLSGDAVLQVSAFNGANQVAAYSTNAQPVVGAEWYWISFSNFTIPAAYTSVQVFPRLETPMPKNGKLDLDGVLIEKTAVAGEYFDGLSSGSGGVIVTELKSRSGREIPVIPVDAIEDSSFTIDSTEVIDQVKIDFFRDNNNTPLMSPEEDYLEVGHNVEATMVFGAIGSNTSATQRAFKGENVIYQGDTIPPQPPKLDAVSPLLVRAQAALAAQSQPRWRLTNGLRIVLKELPYHSGLIDLIEEAGRFGQLIKIEGAPEMVDEYLRIRSGQIVLGDYPSLEFEVEPVDYSGPTALSRNSAYYDTISRAITLNDLQEISSNDLRSIGAR